MPLTGRVPARIGDPVVTGLVALAVFGLRGFDATLDRDQGTFVYAGKEAARGVPPFVGIFNSVGPVGDLVTGAGIRVGSSLGVDAVLAARVTYLLVSAVVVAVLSVLGREALDPHDTATARVAGLLTPGLFLTFESFLKLATGGPREKTVMVLFLELALLALLRRRWSWAGAASALAALTWQPAALSLAAAALAALATLATEAGPRGRAAAAYAAGALVPAGLGTLLYLVSGHLTRAWWGLVVVNVGYTRQPSILDSWHLVTRDYGVSTALVVVGWLSLLTIGAAAARRVVRAEPAPSDLALVVLLAGGFVAGAWTCYAVNGGADLFVVLPYAALGLGAAVAGTARSLPVAAARRVTAGLAGLAVVAAGAEAVTSRDSRLLAERRDVTGVAALLPAGSTVVSVNAPEVLVLLDRRNPTPWQLSNSATAPFLDDHLPAGLAGLAARISRTRPEVVVVGRHSVVDWLLPVLHAHYRRVGKADHWSWYASRRLDPALRRQMREVNAAAWGR